MDTISPVIVDAFALLHRNLYRHLDEAEFLAQKCRAWSQQDSDAARELIPDLVVVIRGVLSEHEATPNGACRTCTSPWPCSMTMTSSSMWVCGGCGVWPGSRVSRPVTNFVLPGVSPAR